MDAAYDLYNEDFLTGVDRLEDGTVDLIVADPPYGLGKDYGNNSDKLETTEFLEWTTTWANAAIPKLKPNGSLYIFTTWRYSPEIFSYLKTKMIHLNEIIWDRCAPSMGGSTRRYSFVHDTIGFFAKSTDYYFDLDAVRVPYDPETKKARTRPDFVGKKWLEMGHNPKDLWKVSYLHSKHHERENHPTQKPLEIIERMVKASSPKGGLVLDPFAGSGTTVEAALKNGRRCITFEINADYCDIIHSRIKSSQHLRQMSLFT